MKAIVAVTNDLNTDQRVNKTCILLEEEGYAVTLVGRRLKSGTELNSRPYKTKRFRLVFTKKFFFYAEYNIRLFIYIMFTKTNLVVANDLDTLPSCFRAAVLKRIPLMYDSHELFTEVPELVDRPKVRDFWKRLEKKYLPRIKYATTVCGSIAAYYRNEYGIEMKVVRNLPIRALFKPEYSRKQVILYQGALNKGRGLEDLIRAMAFIKDTELWIAGTGDIESELKKMVTDQNLSMTVAFLGRMKPVDLAEVTRQATLGVSLEKNMGLNYYYALPNKLFDYIQAGIPVLVSSFPEMKGIVEKYEVGVAISDTTPELIAQTVNSILSDPEKLRFYRANALKAAEELVWENEKLVLQDLVRSIK